MSGARGGGGEESAAAERARGGDTGERAGMGRNGKAAAPVGEGEGRVWLRLLVLRETADGPVLRGGSGEGRGGRGGGGKQKRCRAAKCERVHGA